MSWFDGRMLAFDVESTGPIPQEDRIVTAAVALVGGGQPVEATAWLVATEVPISDGAEEVHGISNERAQADGGPPTVAVGMIVEAIENRPEGAPVVAYNARFDLTMLDREARRYGIEPAGTRGRPLHVVDPFVIWKWIDRYRKGGRKLTDAAAAFGAAPPNAHEAYSDALAAARIAWVLAAKAQFVARAASDRRVGQETWDAVRGDLALLHEAQVGWADEQAVGLREYFRSKWEHEKAASVEAAWPVVPFEEGS